MAQAVRKTNVDIVAYRIACLSAIKVSYFNKNCSPAEIIWIQGDNLRWQYTLGKHLDERDPYFRWIVRCAVTIPVKKKEIFQLTSNKFVFVRHI